MSEKVLEKLTERFSDHVIATHNFRGDETAIVDRSIVVEAIRWLHDTPKIELDMLTDMTAVDWLEQGQTPRFEVVYQLYSVAHKHRLRIKVQVPAEDPVVDTLTDVYAIADWLEREIWDMYGIRFKGHPNMKRILLYEEFVGHPLRKDYPKERRQPLMRRPENEIAEVLARRGGARSLPTPTRESTK